MIPCDAGASSVSFVLHGTSHVAFFAIGMLYRGVPFRTLDAAAGQDLRTLRLPANFSLM
jgi:hypothetical protein